MADRPLLHRIHNPSNYVCGCDRDCWCRATRVGRLVKWWFPARWFGIRHKNSFFDGMSWDEIRAWKRDQEAKGLYPQDGPRSLIRAALEDPPEDLAELRGVLLRELEWRRQEGIA